MGRAPIRLRLRGGVCEVRGVRGGGGRGAFARQGNQPSSLSLYLVSRAGRGAQPQPASQKVPRTPGQVPERQGRRLESILGVPSSLRFPGKGTDGTGVGCVWVCWDLSFFFRGLLFWGRKPGLCLNSALHACRSGHPGGDLLGGRRLPAGFLNQVNFPGSAPASQPACYLGSSPARPKPPSSPCAWEGWRCRGVAVTDCVCGVVYMCVCVRCVYVCACMPVCMYMYVRAGGRIQLSGAGWCCCCPRPAQTTTPLIITGQGQHIVCGHCSCPGPPSISRPGPPAARVPAQGPLRDRRGLYFGGGCLIPRADPGLWVCLGRVRGGGGVWTVFKLFALEVSSVPMYGMYVFMYVCLTFLVAFYF